MDAVSSPLVIVGLCIGVLSLLERILKRYNKKNDKILEKINKSKESLLKLSDRATENEALELLDDVLSMYDKLDDLVDLNFVIPS